VNWLDDHVLLKDIRVYELAKKFNLPRLKMHCAYELEKRLSGDWSCDEFVECVHEVYEYTSDGDPQHLRFVMVEAAKHCARELIENDIFEQLIREGGDFAFEFLKFLIPHLSLD
jgi:hypothetical protein